MSCFRDAILCVNLPGRFSAPRRCGQSSRLGMRAMDRQKNNISGHYLYMLSLSLHNADSAYIWRLHLHPAQRLIRPGVLKAEAHLLLVTLPALNRLPLHLHRLGLQRAILPTGVQFEALHAHRWHYMSLLATITGAVREHDAPVAGQGACQRQILGCLLRVLQRLQLVQPAICTYVAPVDLFNRLVEDVLYRLLAHRQLQLPWYREQPAAHTKTSTRGRTVVLHVELMGNLLWLQLALWKKNAAMISVLIGMQ